MRRQEFGIVEQADLVRQRPEIVQSPANQDVDRLGRVHDAAPSHDDHAVGATLPVEGSPLVDQVDPGILHNVVIDAGQLEAGFLDGIDDHLGHAGLNQSFVRVQGHLCAAELLHLETQFLTQTSLVHDPRPVDPGEERLERDIWILHA